MFNRNLIIIHTTLDDISHRLTYHSQVMFSFFSLSTSPILLYHYEPTGVESVIDWSRAKAMLSFS